MLDLKEKNSYLFSQGFSRTELSDLEIPGQITQ